MAIADRSRSRTRLLRAVRDHLSDLPEDLIRHIITYLPVTDAARTAAIASRWSHLWRSTPLYLYDADIPEHTRDSVIPQALADHHGPFRAVILYDCRLASLDRELPDWPRLLVARRTEKLLLAHGWEKDQPNSERLLPADILRCKSLQELALDFWTFPSGTQVLLPQLQFLAMVRIAISDQDLECFIAAIPVLKFLRLALNSPNHIRLRSQSLGCALVGLLSVEEFTVVDTPLLERLYLYMPPKGDDVVGLRIDSAPNLRVLGYLDTRAHKLQIGDSVIGLDTMASASTVVPSVNILALTVNFGVFREVKMLASFLRCFPNISTLHIEAAMHGPSVTANEPSREHHTRFWKEITPVYCLGSHVKKVFIHDFHGGQNEFEFLNFITMNAQELQSLLVGPHKGILSSDDKMNEIKEELQCLRFPTGMSGELQMSPEAGISSRLQIADNLTIDDPFEC